MLAPIGAKPQVVIDVIVRKDVACVVLGDLQQSWRERHRDGNEGARVFGSLDVDGVVGLVAQHDGLAEALSPTADAHHTIHNMAAACEDADVTGMGFIEHAHGLNLPRVSASPLSEFESYHYRNKKTLPSRHRLLQQPS